MRVLRRLARLNVSQLQSPTPGRMPEVTTGQRRAVVAGNGHRPATHDEDLVQHPCHAPAGEVRVYLQRQTFPRERINYAQGADVSARRRSHHEQSPMPTPDWRRSEQAAAIQRAHSAGASSASDTQARLAMYPPQPVMVHSSALAFDHHLQSPVAVARYSRASAPASPAVIRVVAPKCGSRGKPHLGREDTHVRVYSLTESKTTQRLDSSFSIKSFLL